MSYRDDLNAAHEVIAERDNALNLQKKKMEELKDQVKKLKTATAKQPSPSWVWIAVASWEAVAILVMGILFGSQHTRTEEVESPQPERIEVPLYLDRVSALGVGEHIRGIFTLGDESLVEIRATRTSGCCEDKCSINVRSAQTKGSIIASGTTVKTILPAGRHSVSVPAGGSCSTGEAVAITMTVYTRARTLHDVQ